MTVPTTGPESVTIECKFCTVPVDGPGDICAFCRDYTPPSTPAADGLLADAHVSARRAAEDVSDALDAMPGDVPLLAVVDLVAARAHLRAAQRLIDRAATLVTATEAVAR